MFQQLHDLDDRQGTGEYRGTWIAMPLAGDDPPSPQPKRRSRWWWFLLILLTAVGLFGAIYFLW